MYLHFKNWHSSSLLLKYRDVSWKAYFNVVCLCVHACMHMCVCVLCIWRYMRRTGATLRNTVLFGDSVLAGGQQLTSQAKHDSPSVGSQGHINQHIPFSWAQEMELGPCPCPCKASSLQSKPSSSNPHQIPKHKALYFTEITKKQTAKEVLYPSHRSIQGKSRNLIDYSLPRAPFTCLAVLPAPQILN